MTVSVPPTPWPARRITLPAVRGPLTERLFAGLTDDPSRTISAGPLPADVIGDDDFQMALYIVNEMHYAAIEGVDDRWEWAPGLMGFRNALEEAFLESVGGLTPDAAADELTDVGHALRHIVLEDGGPPLARYMEHEATLEQMLEQIVHRSAYQLKEADPHTFTIPRLAGAAKAAMVEIQYDEYGAGRVARMHAVMFADTMRELELDSSYGSYIDRLPGITLSGVNLNTLFALHRRLRGASVGHLAVFEMTSSVPNRRYGNALRRMGFGPPITTFYDEHVEADSVHEEIAVWELANGLCSAEPTQAREVLFGARAVLAIEARWAKYLLDRWKEGRSSLLRAL